jgi:hypothetical protein
VRLAQSERLRKFFKIFQPLDGVLLVLLHRIDAQAAAAVHRTDGFLGRRKQRHQRLLSVKPAIDGRVFHFVLVHHPGSLILGERQESLRPESEQSKFQHDVVMGKRNLLKNKQL